MVPHVGLPPYLLLLHHCIPSENGNRISATQSVTKYVVTKLMSNCWGFSGSDGPLEFVSENTFWGSIESKDLDWDSIESKDSKIRITGEDY